MSHPIPGYDYMGDDYDGPEDDYYKDMDDDQYDDDGQPDEMQEWAGLADAGYGTDEDYGYYGDSDC
jgi:hypothetical protein